MGGVLGLAPGAAALFLIAALSLAGMPPFSGFLAKVVLLRIGLQGQQYAVVAVAVATSFLTLLSMMKIWTYAFWGPAARAASSAPWRALAMPTGVLVAATVALGIVAQPFLRLAAATAADLATPTAYVEAVLGGRSAP
jgi:multicomponent Na+:H+ antiporter subunit D